MEREIRRFTVELPKEVHTALKLLASIEDETMGKIIENAVKEKVQIAVKQGKLPDKLMKTS